MAQVKLTIGEAADILGVSPKTIRHYHAIGLLNEPMRTENGYRAYGSAELRQIQTIRQLQGFGLSLRQIHFILNSDDSDTDLQKFLLQRDADLSETIEQLQRQQTRIRAALDGDLRQPGDTASNVSAKDILQYVMRPAAGGLTDVLLEVETVALDELDRYPQHANYGQFWEHVATALTQLLRPSEHQIILWLERYLALQGLSSGDLQAQAWLHELRSSPTTALLARAFKLPLSSSLPVHEQEQLQRLIPLLWYEHASPLQREFLAALTSKKRLE